MGARRNALAAIGAAALILALGGAVVLAQRPSPRTRIVFHGFDAIRAIGVDGSHPRTLAKFEKGAGPIVVLTDIAAAKNGRRIAAVTQKLASAGPSSVLVNRIFIFRGDGSQRRTQFQPFVDEGVNSIAMSSDGREIAFPKGDGMFIARVDSKRMRRLTTGNDKHPAFSKDGRKVLFERNSSGNQDIWVVSTGGGAPTRLTSSNADETNPVFSPSGREIAYGSDAAGGQLRMMRANGSGDHLVTRTGADEETEPDFSPGGGAIVFIAKTGGSFRLFTIRADGTHRKLVSGNLGAKGPQWTRNP